MIADPVRSRALQLTREGAPLALSPEVRPVHFWRYLAVPKVLDRVGWFERTKSMRNPGRTGKKEFREEMEIKA
jgi:hypothetical protein